MINLEWYDNITCFAGRWSNWKWMPNVTNPNSTLNL